MSLELGLLILESVLLLATMFLLVLSIKEGRGRNELIMEVSRATKVLTRHEYFLTVADSMAESEQEIVGCITGRPPQGDDIHWTRELVYIIEKRAAAGVQVKYILPRLQDRLHIGWLYSRAGADVRYSSCPLVLDFRYTVLDGKSAVIGVPEAVGEKEATKKGYRIPSESLASILRRHFYDCWGDTVSHEDYLRETLAQSGVTAETLARELGIDQEVLAKWQGGEASE